MPKRNRIRTITGGPQGEDALIQIRIPSVGEMRAQSKIHQRLGQESDEAEESAREYLAAHTLSWNWVNDQDEPLPSPHNNPDIFQDMTPEELKWIGDHLSGASRAEVEARKNLKNGS